MMNSFTKVVRLGVGDCGSVFCQITYNRDGNRNLSITGVEGPKKNGDCRGSCGQIVMSGLNINTYAPGWDKGKVTQFELIWNEWHLNDMKAGSPVQEAYLKAHPVVHSYPQSHYDETCKTLAAAGLHPDADGYKYGSAWKRVEVPEHVLEWLAALPEADVKPAWV